MILFITDLEFDCVVEHTLEGAKRRPRHSQELLRPAVESARRWAISEIPWLIPGKDGATR